MNLQEITNSKFLLKNNLILPHQPETDFFLGYMKHFLHAARWFGIAGSGSKYWRAWGLGLLTGLVVIDATSIYRVIRALGGLAADTTGSIAARFSGTVFYTTAICSLILSWRFSASWNKLSDAWTAVDKSIALNLPSDRTLKSRMFVITSFLVTGAIFEHVLSMVAFIGLDCPPSLTIMLKRYILTANGYLFRTEHYSLWLAIPCFVAGKIATALWNFHDLLIVLVSMGLKSRYIRLNEYLSTVVTHEKKNYKWCKDTNKIKEFNWRKIREAYVQQAGLVRVFDGAVGGLILLSSASNFYFICLQLFLGITQGFSTDQVKRLYFLLSLIWLLVRTSFTILAAANVNVKSREVLRFLHACESRCFNTEVERLQTQISRDNVYLTGIGLFRINRSILLKMAAAIITYELVLIEFDDK